MGVHVDEGQGAVSGGAGAEDGVGDQVVSPQAHWNTLVGEYCPEEDVSSAAHVTASLVLLCDAVTSSPDIVQISHHIPNISNLQSEN